MKKQHKAAISFALALIFALVSLPASALPRFEAKAEITPAWTVPEGYNAHDYTKCVTFLEQTDENGVKNGEKLSETYDPNDPETWGTNWDGNRFQWISVAGEQRIVKIDVYAEYLFGSMDVSDCTALEWLDCGYNNLSELNVSGCTALYWLDCRSNNLSALDVSGCTALEYLYCHSNNLSELNVSGCTALEELGCEENNLSELDVSSCTSLWELACYSNNLSELDVSGCTALEYLYCDYNNLGELDVTQNTALIWLSCDNNNLTELDVSGCTSLWELSCEENNLSELDLSNNHYLAYDTILAEGEGLIGYSCSWSVSAGNLYAYPVNGASFEGFYDENGALISEGEWDEDDEAYVFEFEGYPGDFTGTVIVRFSGGATVPGDVDGNGSVSVADAITTLRLAMQLSDGSGLNTGNADMDGNGSITIADAIMILRTAMGLA